MLSVAEVVKENIKLVYDSCLAKAENRLVVPVKETGLAVSVAATMTAAALMACPPWRRPGQSAGWLASTNPSTSLRPEKTA